MAQPETTVELLSSLNLEEAFFIVFSFIKLIDILVSNDSPKIAYYSLKQL